MNTLKHRRMENLKMRNRLWKNIKVFSVQKAVKNPWWVKLKFYFSITLQKFPECWWYSILWWFSGKLRKMGTWTWAVSVSPSLAEVPSNWNPQPPMCLSNRCPKWLPQHWNSGIYIINIIMYKICINYLC